MEPYNNFNIKNVLERIPGVSCIQKLIEEINSDFYSTNCSGRLIDYNDKTGIISRFVDNCKEEQLKKLCNRLEEEQKDLVKKFPLRNTDKVKDDTDFIFVNRKDELYKLRRFDSIQLCEISGCGRTHLLKKFKKEKEYEGWKVFFIELKKCLGEIIKGYGYDKENKSPDDAVNNWLNKIKCNSAKLEESLEKKNKILFIVDDYNRVDSFKDIARKCFDNYLRDCYDKLELNGDPDRRKGKFILSYRVPFDIKSFTDEGWRDNKRIRLEVVGLKPISKNSVQAFIKAKDEKSESRRYYEPYECWEMTNEICFYSGGHPKVLDQLIYIGLNCRNNFKAGCYKEEFENIVRKTLEDISNFDNENLKKILPALCVLRRFSSGTLGIFFEKFYEKDKLDISKINNEIKLFELDDNYYYYAPIVRNLYLNSFLKDEFDKFKEINEFAFQNNKKIYKGEDYLTAKDTILFVDNLYYLTIKYKKTNEIERATDFYKEIHNILCLKSFPCTIQKEVLGEKINRILKSIEEDNDLNSLLSPKELEKIKEKINKSYGRV